MKLNNGAEILQQKGDVVLAKWRGEEYVTWKVDNEGNAYWGHYFPNNLASATVDFEKRCAN